MCGDDMFNFFRRRNNNSDTQMNNEASEYLLAAEKLTQIMCSTDDVNRFFPLYQRILDLISLIENMSPKKPILHDARELKKQLLNPEMTNEFFDRCLKNKQLQACRDDIITYRDIMPKKSYDYFVHLSGLNYEQYIYCNVTFDDERSYYYISEIEDIEPGDLVVVPVGPNNDEKIATVIEVNIYRYDNVPYPVHLTKSIISQIA